MSRADRPRRSALYMPGSNARALEKAKSLPADALILDLEDAVSPEAKETARDQVCDGVAAGGYGRRELLIRVNGLATPWGHQDITRAVASGAQAIVLPKVESADMVRQAEFVMTAAGAGSGMALWCMIETPDGVLQAPEIARASPRLGGLIMGTSDLAKELHAAHTPGREALLPSFGICLLAARAAGIVILDGVYLDLDDTAGFEASCRQGAALGFDGKTVIHPKQLDAANQMFAPSAEDIAWSRRIIGAHAAAEKDGQGVVLVDGKLIENLHVADARRMVALAEAIEESEGAAA